MKIDDLSEKAKKAEQEKDEVEDFKYRCVHCGHPLKELTVVYSPTIQKLTECEKCHEIADNLIEFETIVIIIDLILLSIQAQRHVLFNTNCKNLYKTLMVITLLESYCLWMENFDKKFEDESANDPLYLEKGFYLSTMQVVLCELQLILLATRKVFNNPSLFFSQLFLLRHHQNNHQLHEHEKCNN